MNQSSKAVSVAVTLAAGIGALMIGGGAPPDPSKLLSVASEARRNAAVAATNIDVARRDTEALATISDNVLRQLKASERLLRVQLDIESSSKASVRASGELTTQMRGLRAELEELRRGLHRLSVLARDAGGDAGRAAASARNLRASLDRLQQRFDALIQESRELNRKARGYEELQDGPT